jgi:hypothetical protein
MPDEAFGCNAIEMYQVNILFIYNLVFTSNANTNIFINQKFLSVKPRYKNNGITINEKINSRFLNCILISYSMSRS